MTEGSSSGHSTELNYFDYAAIDDLPEVAIRIGMLAKRLDADARNKPGSRVLEIGLGAGDVTLMLSRRFQNIICLDQERNVVEHVRVRIQGEAVPLPAFVEAKVEDSEFPPEYFDNIILFGILEHVQDPVRTLRRISQWLRPGGKIYITVNLANSIHRMLGVAMGIIGSVTELSDSDRRIGHYRIYTLAELKQNIADAGLSISYERNFYLKPLPTSMLSELPMDVHLGLSKLGEAIPEYASYVYVEAEGTLPITDGQR